MYFMGRKFHFNRSLKIITENYLIQSQYQEYYYFIEAILYKTRYIQRLGII